MTVGARIKELREARGITQTELARHLHTQKQTIYKYENDIITNIPYNKIILAAQFFDVSPSYLMGWEDEKANMTLGEKIKDARLTKGYTQRQLAEILKVKNTAVCNWESGLNKPDANTIARICSVLGVSANYLLGFAEDSPIQKEQQELINAYDAAGISTKNAVRRVLGLPDLQVPQSQSDEIDYDAAREWLEQYKKRQEHTAQIAAFGEGATTREYTAEELENARKILEDMRKNQ